MRRVAAGIALVTATVASQELELRSTSGLGSAEAWGEAPVRVTLTELRLPLAESVNALVNGTLEAREGWEIVGDRSRVREQTNEGGHHAELRSAPEPGGVTAIAQEFRVRGGERYLFSARFQAEGGLLPGRYAQGMTRAGVRVQHLSSSGDVIEEEDVLILEGAYGAWRRQSAWFTPPAGVSQTRLLVGVVTQSAEAQPVVLHVDDVAVWPEEALVAETVSSPLEAGRVSLRGAPRLEWETEEVDGALALRMRLSGASSPRALWIDVDLPLGEGAWRWHPDLIRSAPITRDAEAWAVSADHSGDLPLSVLPLAAVTSETQTLGAVSPPAHCQIAAIGVAGGSLRIRLAAGTMPRRTETFALWLHRGPAAWGARGVLAHHRAVAPEHFTARGDERRAIHGGTMAPAFEVTNPADFGFVVAQTTDLETADAASRWFRQTAVLGAEPALYLLPWADEPTVAERGRPLPTLDEALEIEASARGEAGHQADLRRAGAASRVPDTTGEPLVSEVFRAPWRGQAWVLRLPMDLSVDLDGGRGPLALASARRAAEAALSLGERAPILQMDNFFMDSDAVVTDERWLTRCEGPLTFSPNTLTPAAPLAENHARWLRALAEQAGEAGRLSGNVLRAGVAQFGLPWLDGFGFEGRATADRAGSENWMIEDLAWRRALAGGRPVVALLSTPPEESTPRAAEAAWHRCLAFAITPTFTSMWQRPGDLESLRVLYQRFLPLVRRMEEAGWEPVTGAWTEDAGFVIERYGDRLLAVHSAAARRAEVTVRVDWETLGLAPPESVEELVTRQPLTVAGGAVTVPLEPGRTAVLALGGERP